MPHPLARRLLKWYAVRGRALPWRGARDPYAIWVSEIMLQQTRVEVVSAYYARWMQRFPTLAALAAADLQEVLAVWEGLGYYGRARNLHRAARIVVADHGGRLPQKADDL
jgi:A/G-specific adenine glycosylase